VPEAQDDFINEDAFASGMKTNALITTTNTNLRRLSYIHEQSHAIIGTNTFKSLSRPQIEREKALTKPLKCSKLPTVISQ
jgi:hypothetical protein